MVSLHAAAQRSLASSRPARQRHPPWRRAKLAGHLWHCGRRGAASRPPPAGRALRVGALHRELHERAKLREDRDAAVRIRLAAELLVDAHRVDHRGAHRLAGGCQHAQAEQASLVEGVDILAAGTLAQPQLLCAAALCEQLGEARASMRRWSSRARGGLPFPFTRGWPPASRRLDTVDGKLRSVGQRLHPLGGGVVEGPQRRRAASRSAAVPSSPCSARVARRRRARAARCRRRSPHHAAKRLELARLPRAAEQCRASLERQPTRATEHRGEADASAYGRRRHRRATGATVSDAPDVRRAGAVARRKALGSVGARQPRLDRRARRVQRQAEPSAGAERRLGRRAPAQGEATALVGGREHEHRRVGRRSRATRRRRPRRIATTAGGSAALAAEAAAQVAPCSHAARRARRVWLVERHSTLPDGELRRAQRLWASRRATP